MKNIDWKKITNQFKDDYIWDKRILQFNKAGFDSIDHFYDCCNKLDDTADLNAFLNEILSPFKNFDADYYAEHVAKHDNVISYSIPQLSGYIYNHILEILSNTDIKYENKQNICAEIVDAFMPSLLNNIYNTLKFEYQVYLTSEDAVDNEEHLLQFVCHITTNPEWIQMFFEEYPVALRKIYRLISNYIQFVSDLIFHIAQDFKDLMRFLNIPTNTNVTSIKTCLGDLHNNAKSTVKITFSHYSESVNVFYKPRKADGEMFFANIYNFMKSIGLKDSLLMPETLFKNTYHWQKELHGLTSSNDDDVKKYYFNQGINCARAHVFGIEDLISDNIIACGSKPGFFDLEILLRPEFKQGNHYWSGSAASRHNNECVLKTGLLPEFGFETFDSPGHSNAGLSKNPNSDFSNLPQLNGHCVTIDNYYYDFEKGFIHAYSLISNNKSRIWDQIKINLDNLNSPFKTRLLIRYTYIYSHLIDATAQPNALCKHIEYYKILEALWMGFDKFILSEDVIQSEINQIDNGDYPMFYAKIDSTALYNAEGLVIAEDYFAKSGIDRLMLKITNLNLDLMNLQINIMRRSFNIHNDVDIPLITDEKVNTSNLDLISQIELRLECLNLDDRDNSYFSYLDYVIDKESRWSQGIVGMDLFQGLLGLGLFFVANAKRTGNSNNLANAEKIFNQAVGAFEKNKLVLLDGPVASIGITHYPLSILYFSLISSKILNKNYFDISVDQLFQIKQYINVSITKDRELDYLFGSAGAVLLLMAFDNYHKTDYFSQEINSIGQRLIDRAIPAGNNMITWRSRSFDMWGGWGHGNASLSYALFNLHHYTDNQQFYDLAIKALQYDQALYDKKTGYWRKTLDIAGDMHGGWASGTAGIGLSRYLISKYYSNEFMSYELSIIKDKLEMELEHYFEIDHSVCSGFLGILEIYQMLYGNNNTAEMWLNRYFSEIQSLNDIRTGGWPKNQFINGLYYGAAGVGYSCVKFKYKDINIPSLLWI